MRGFLPYGLLAIASAATAACSPTVYLIRHGEKPSDGGNGLNAQGVKRSQCIRKIFGQDSDYNITHIMAQTPKSNGKRARPLDTVKPLAEDLGLKVDTSCDRDDPDCVKKVVDDYDGEGNILICWEHDTLTDILETLGVKDAPSYPDDSFDIIWTLPSPYDEMSKDTKENCPGLDD
ncbi:hypothetical protein N7471_011828 [Penicillium samsonianum]|uniref:uncharacterized protein n=1 Tax=Penicillium samsonianum TaxID=1882272 RepID=UPI002547CB98|nr:uncharacterized protein N7471_011828 [Penicillium samsonianum]KAJ6124511.1 hypothetical protein N7471_011828 [Penicillium samsonianum]